MHSGLLKEMIKWRHHFHTHPELAYEEVDTAKYIVSLLKNMGVDEVHEGIGQTGVVGVILGSQKEERQIGLRADMDALPLQEKNHFGHRSQYDGKMHACGHDGHMAILLGAGQYFCETRNFPGKIYLIFQPAEEGHAGAKKMIDEGLFDRFPMDAIFGLHNWPGLPEGTIGIKPHTIMAASDRLEIKVIGKGGHGAIPHQANDPIAIAGQLISAIQHISSRKIDPQDGNVISICEIHGGTSFNIIPDSVILNGTLRSLTAETRDLQEKSLKEICQGIEKAYSCRIECQITRCYPPTINDLSMTKFIEQQAQKIFNENEIFTDIPASMGGEDFAFFLEKKPGCYFWLGAGHPERGSCTIHSPHFDFNDQILGKGLEMWKAIGENFPLSKENN